MQEKVPDFPNAIEAFFLIVALFAAEYLISAAFYDAHKLLNLNSMEAAALITLLGNGLVFTAIMHFKHLSYRQLFHSSKAKPSTTFFAFLPPILLILPGLSLAMLTVSNFVSYVFPPSEAQQAMFEEMGSNHLAMLIATCVLAPILEEMLFRGIILRSFLHQYQRWPAIIGSALLFGAAHGNLYQFVVASLGGLLLGWLYERSGSLLPSITLHALYNAAPNVMDVYFDTNGRNLLADSSAIIWIIAALLAGYGSHCLRRIFLQNQIKQPKK